MKTEDANRENTSQDDFSAAGCRANNANDLLGSGRRQYECNRCRRIFNHLKAMEKHMLACKGSPAIPGIKDKLQKTSDHSTEDVKQIFEIISAPIDEGRVTEYEVLQALGTVNNRVPPTETHIEDMTHLNNIKKKKTEALEKNTPLLTCDSDSGVILKNLEIDRKTTQSNAEGDLTPDEKNKLNLSGISPTIAALQSPHGKVDENVYKCDFCDDTFEEPSLLEKHRSRHLEVKKQRSNQCHICFKSYKNRVVLYSHLIKHTPRFKCEHCSKTFQRAKHLEIHIGRHLGIKPHPCTVCKSSFATTSDLKSHMEIHSKKRYDCGFCKRTFLKKTTLEDHRNVHLGIKPHKCPYCKREFSYSYMLKKHHTTCALRSSSVGEAMKPNMDDFKKPQEMLNGDSEEPGPEKIKDLEQAVVHFKDLNDGKDTVPESSKNRMTLDEEEKKAKSLEIFQTTSALRNHRQSSHNKEERGRRRCDFCDALFAEPALLEEHRNRHLKVREQSSSQCYICFKSFRKRYYLSIHLVSHTSRFKCEHCSKTFQSAPILKEHLRRHLGIKLHQCTTCQAAYVSASELWRHRKTNCKRYKCDLCVRVFLEKKSLEDHKNVHLKLYKCTDCERAFSTSKVLIKHKNSCRRKFAMNIKTIGNETTNPNSELIDNKIPENPKQTEECSTGTRTLGIEKFKDADSTAQLKMLDDSKETDINRFGADMEGNEEEMDRRLRKSSTLSTPAFRKYLRSHHLKVQEKKYRCNFCDDTFADPSSLADHRNRHLEIKNKNSNQCHICFRFYSNRNSLRSHLIAHTSRYKCEYCSKTFSQAGFFKEHIRRHLGIKPHQCGICKTSFISPVDLRKHMDKAHFEGIQSKKYECDVCGRAFSKKTVLEDHRNIHLGLKPHKCSFCKEEFTTFPSLVKHHNLYHKSEYQPVGSEEYFSDPTAFEAKSTNTKLNEKSEAATSATLYICPLCSNAYSSRHARDTHFNKHTSRFKCEFCEKTCNSSSHLKKHIKVHSHVEEPPNVTKHQLMKSQSEEPASNYGSVKLEVFDGVTNNPTQSPDDSTDKTYANPCHICLKSYKSRDALRVHLITHTPRFKCKYCGECMQSAPHLERHEARHLGIKRNVEPKRKPIPGPPFKCTFCTKTYPRRQSLKQHLNTHTGRFECEHCSKQCISASQLKSHISGHLRLEKKTTAKNYKCNQTKNPVIKNETVEPYDAVSIVHMEAQDNVLKDAVCFDDEQEYKPIVDTSTLDKITGVELYDSETENGSTITPGQKNHIVKIEKIELDEIIDPTHINSETKSYSDEINSVNGPQYSRFIKEEYYSPPLNADNEVELGGISRFPGEAEKPIPTLQSDVDEKHCL